MAQAKKRTVTAVKTKPSSKNITEAPAAQKTKKSFSGVIMLVLFAAVIGCIVLLSQRPPSDERLLTQAIENSMSKKTATLTYNTDDETTHFKAIYNIDYSDITSLKTSGNMEIRSVESNELVPTFKVEYVWPGDDKAYVMLTEIEANEGFDASAYLNQWITVDQSDATRQAFTGATQDPGLLAISIAAGSLQNVTQVFGELPDGNFSKDQRIKLMEIVEEEMVYQLNSARDEEIDGRTYRRLDITISADGVKKLNDKVAEYAGGVPPLQIIPVDSEYYVLIDPETRFIFRAGSDEETFVSYREDTNINDMLTVQTPENSVSFIDFVGINSVPESAN